MANPKSLEKTISLIRNVQFILTGSTFFALGFVGWKDSAFGPGNPSALFIFTLSMLMYWIVTLTFSYVRLQLENANSLTTDFLQDNDKVLYHKTQRFRFALLTEAVTSLTLPVVGFLVMFQTSNVLENPLAWIKFIVAVVCLAFISLPFYFKYKKHQKAIDFALDKAFEDHIARIKSS